MSDNKGRINTSIEVDVARVLRVLGGGNLSRGIRLAVLYLARGHESIAPSDLAAARMLIHAKFGPPAPTQAGRSEDFEPI